eukprot:1345667-Pyramimonas_sp.AAC.1
MWHVTLAPWGSGDFLCASHDGARLWACQVWAPRPLPRSTAMRARRTPRRALISRGGPLDQAARSPPRGWARIPAQIPDRP